MAIQAGDIKLVASSVMDDVPEGGGAPSATIIPDASTNSIFPDISELARAGGRVNLRKVHVKVRTLDTEAYFDVNVIVADPFEDPLVSATLFTTGDVFDRRAEAAERMESYLARGAPYSGLLFSDHLAGQMVVVLLQRAEVPLPIVGQTLVLAKNPGLVNEFAQFVRLTNVTATTRTFSDSSGDYQRVQVVCEISDQLQEDFPGFEAFRFDSGVGFAGRTRVYETLVADAARYYGVVPLTEPVAIGDFTVQASGIYTQLVPSTRIEVPIADARMNQQSGALVAAAIGPFTRSLTLAWVAGSAMFVGGGILPGSFSVSRGGVTITDKGGVLVNAAQEQVGTVDYENGIATLSVSVFGTGAGAHSVTYTPASAPTLVSESYGVRVTAESQRSSWALSLDPPPARGTLQVSYRAGGNWYVLKDDGSGALRGSSSSVGAGSLNDSTGTISVTLGALPDVGSSLIMTSQPAAASLPMARVDESAPALPRRFGKVMTLGRAIKPGTLSLTWDDGSARTATDAAGLLTGDATGVVNYAEGIVDFRPNLLPAKNTVISVALTETSKTAANLPTMTDGGSTWTGSLPANQKAGSVEMSVVAGVPTERDPDGAFLRSLRSLRVTDNGSGSLRAAGGSGPVTVGTINYTTGAFTLQKTISAGYVSTVAVYEYVNPVLGFPVRRLIGHFPREASLDIYNGPGAAQVPVPEWAWWTGSQGNAVEARAAGADLPAFSGTVTLDNIFMPANAAGYGATTQFSTEVLSFDLGGNFYAKSGSTYVVSPDPATGLGTVVGSASTVAGMSGVLLTAWPISAASLVTRIAGASQPPLGTGTPLTTTGVTFRTAVSPLVNSGFQVAGAFAVSGVSFTATANSAGVIATGTAAVGETPGSYGVFGKVDFDQGIATLQFGRRVPVSMAAAVGVVDLSSLGIAGVQYVQSYPVRADQLRYNATGYSYLPLDPDILGLNPVRLPADGRVPIFRTGTYAVLGHTGKVGPATVANAQVLNCGRTRLSRVRVIGNDGNVIDTGYAADLDAGIVTFNDVTGYSQPVTVEHRIEDTVQVRNAQINGQLSFTRPSTHAYPVPGSYVSSALVAGDVRARVQPAFDQVSWTNVWSDAPIGSSATGAFNDTQNPITTTNLGALTERWYCVFTNSTSFNVVGEHVGVIATGNTGSNCAPLNPSTGAAYFNIPAAGWGLGWSAGNVMRFNTVGAEVPIWVARTILQGPETVENDEFTILIRGDVNRP